MRPICAKRHNDRNDFNPAHLQYLRLATHWRITIAVGNSSNLALSFIGIGYSNCNPWSLIPMTSNACSPSATEFANATKVFLTSASFGIDALCSTNRLSDPVSNARICASLIILNRYTKGRALEREREIKLENLSTGEPD